MLYLYEVVIMYNIQKFLIHFYVVAFRVQTFCFPVNVWEVKFPAKQNSAFTIPIVVLLYVVDDFLKFFHLGRGVCAVGPVETAQQDGFLALHK